VPLLESPAHRTIPLNLNAPGVGIGIAYDSVNQILEVTIDFCLSQRYVAILKRDSHVASLDSA
jgi:hypothetical protein